MGQAQNGACEGAEGTAGEENRDDLAAAETSTQRDGSEEDLHEECLGDGLTTQHTADDRITGTVVILMSLKEGHHQQDHTAGAGSDHGAFACFAPYEDPQIAIVVYGEKVGAGYMLADVAKAVFDTYFSLSMGDDMVQGENQLG